MADEALKNLYKSENTPKYYVIYFPSIDLNINTDGTNDRIVSGSFELTESLCSDNNLIFGSCEASQVKFTVADVTQDLTGLWFTVSQVIGEYTVELGTYKVDTCKKQNNKRLKDITAYDRMILFDVDVAAWYNALDFTGLTVASMRASLCAHIGITEVLTTLPNDSMSVEKTIEPSQISGRDVLFALEEINGAFGHINRDGELEHKVLGLEHPDYPQEDYPEEDYPVDEPYIEYIEKSMYLNNGVNFEEYTVKAYDKLQIRQEENDIGCIHGIGTNTYVIEGNFLAYGKSAGELETIATNVFENIRNRSYRPYTAELIGLPYIEVGDTVKFYTDDTIAGYVLQRTLKGIHALTDTFEANGSEEVQQNFGMNKEIIQLKGRTAKITKTVEEVSASVTALDLQLTGEINVLAGQVVLKVDTNGNIGYIDLLGDPDTDLTSIVLKADNISLEGLVTANGNFKVLLDGSIEAVNGKFSGEITSESGTIGGWIIGENGLTSPSDRMKLAGSGMNLYNSIGSYLGGIASTSSTDNGVVLVKSVAASYFAIASTTDTDPDDGMSISLDILYTPEPVTIGGTFYESGFHFRLTDVYVDYANIYCSAEINGYTGSFTNLYVGGSMIDPSNYATSSEISALSSAVSTMSSALSELSSRVYALEHP